MRKPLTVIGIGEEQTVSNRHRVLIAAAAAAVAGADARVLDIREIAEPNHRVGWTGRQRRHTRVVAARKAAPPPVEVKVRMRAPRKGKTGETPNHA